jgi:hypothetical protein
MGGHGPPPRYPSPRPSASAPAARAQDRLTGEGIGGCGIAVPSVGQFRDEWSEVREGFRSRARSKAASFDGLRMSGNQDPIYLVGSPR